MIPCPKCGKGKLFIDRDVYGYYFSCLACGWQPSTPGNLIKDKPVECTWRGKGKYLGEVGRANKHYGPRLPVDDPRATAYA